VTPADRVGESANRGPEPVRPAAVRRWSAAAGWSESADRVAAEDALQVTLDDEPFAIVMRTPGHDLELVAGLLFAEGLVDSPDEIREVAVAASAEVGASAEIAGAPFPVRELPEANNLVAVTLRRPRPVDAPRGWQRNLVSTTACGVCGHATMEALRTDLRPLPPGPRFARGTIEGLPATMRAAQRVFAETGGLHAAALFGTDGELQLLREDVGRHNAVDKVVGHEFLAGRLPRHDAALVVSGRAAFELAHKAIAAGIPLLAAVSAPSSLAIHVSHEFGLTLVGFLREGRLNVYAGAERIVDTSG